MRQRQPEIMDQPGLDPAAHRQALIGLRRLNRLSRAASALWRPIAKESEHVAPRPLRVLDLACGSGDTAMALARRARSAGTAMHVCGLDMSEVAVAIARQHAAGLRIDDITFEVRDVLSDPIPMPHDGSWDVVMCSLFLHHLSDPDAVRLLERMKSTASRLVIVNDLRRTRFGTLLVKSATRLVSRSPIVHIDGALSAKAAFTSDELSQLAHRAGMHGHTIRRCFPQRMQLEWRPELQDAR